MTAVLAHRIDHKAPRPVCGSTIRLVGITGTCSFCGGQLPEPDDIDRRIIAFEAARSLRLAREALAECATPVPETLTPCEVGLPAGTGVANSTASDEVDV